MRIFIVLFALLLSAGLHGHEIDSLEVSHTQAVEYVERSDSAVCRFLLEAGVETTNNNKITLLNSGKEKFNHLFAHIKKAKHHIHVEYFNFRNDSIASLLFELLKEKKAEGLEVRVMFDAFGNSSNSKPLKKKHLKAIKESGIEIVKFDPINFPYINHVFHRDHRKIVVIDGVVGYTGGMNVADYYINGLPGIGDWRDMHIYIEGEAVHDLQRIFLEMWNKSTKQCVGGERYFPTTDTAYVGKQVAIVDRWPRKQPKLIRQTIAKSIESATEKIQIVNPYFVPTKSIKKEINKALKRGVEVEIMISSKSDISFTPDAAMYTVHKLMKRGAAVYLYEEGFHHSKVMMIDDLFCTVGSTNLNSRSLRYDYETNAFIFDRETTAELCQIYADDKQQSTELTEEVWKQRSKWRRFVGWFAHLFTPVL